MKKYEIMLILDKDTPDTKVLTEKLLSILTSDGSKVIESAEWGLKKFAYPINHKNEGYYFVYICETSYQNIIEFERVCRIDKNVVRNLVINTESEKKYIQNTELSKTDMSKYKEEKRDRSKNFRNFRKPEHDVDNKPSEPNE